MYEIFSALLYNYGVRPADVARATGIHPSVFTDWKKGKSSPKLDKMQKIADYFGVTVGGPSGPMVVYQSHYILRRV